MTSNQNWFLETKEIPAETYMLKGALQISKIAKGSPAAALGLKPGDAFLKVNRRPALTTDLTGELLKGNHVLYEFYRPAARKHLVVKTRALPLGFLTEATSHAIVQKFKAAGNLLELEDLMILWERGDYGHLRQVIKNNRKGGLFGLFPSGRGTDPVAGLIEGVCEIETGNKAKGYAALDHFQKNHMSRYTTNVGALTLFYQALKAEGTPGPDFTNKLWRVMDHYQSSDRMVSKAEEYKIDFDRDGGRLGEKFTYDPLLKCLEGAFEKTQVSALVKALGPDQILPICLMISYRSNGPYNWAMETYQTMYPHVKDRIAPMLVVVQLDQKRTDRPHWHKAEESLIRAGIPITVAHDPDAGFRDRHLTGAPDFIAIDRDFNIVWDLCLDNDYEYWTMLSGSKTL